MGSMMQSLLESQGNGQSQGNSFEMLPELNALRGGVSYNTSGYVPPSTEAGRDRLVSNLLLAEDDTNDTALDHRDASKVDSTLNRWEEVAARDNFRKNTEASSGSFSNLRVPSLPPPEQHVEADTVTYEFEGSSSFGGQDMSRGVTSENMLSTAPPQRMPSMAPPEPPSEFDHSVQQATARDAPGQHDLERVPSMAPPEPPSEVDHGVQQATTRDAPGQHDLERVPSMAPPEPPSEVDHGVQQATTRDQGGGHS
jgi:hypothetical protein